MFLSGMFIAKVFVNSLDVWDDVCCHGSCQDQDGGKRKKDMKRGTKDKP
jgi:hypothetical protein